MEITVEEREIWKTHNLWQCNCEWCKEWRADIERLAYHLEGIKLYETT